MIYKPLDTYWTPDDRASFYKDFGKDLRNFFNKADVKSFVENDNWEKVFIAWEYNNDYTYNPKQLLSEVLAYFLYQLDIDFLPYLSNPKTYSIVCLEE